LEKEGFDVGLTRRGDDDISLTDRCKHAERFGPDLFISIHANSAGKSEEPKGIETFHVNSKPLIGEDSALYNFLFVNTKKDRERAILANGMVKENELLSQKFALSIQNTLIDMLKDNNVKDRGVKKACFLVLLGLLSKTQLPSALVEVGFITNKQEAERLADSKYRGLIAQGIVKGIKSFLGGNS